MYKPGDKFITSSLHQGERQVVVLKEKLSGAAWLTTDGRTIYPPSRGTRLQYDLWSLLP